jgi:hypothetical protein
VAALSSEALDVWNTLGRKHRTLAPAHPRRRHTLALVHTLNWLRALRGLEVKVNAETAGIK